MQSKHSVRKKELPLTVVAFSLNVVKMKALLTFEVVAANVTVVKSKLYL